MAEQRTPSLRERLNRPLYGESPSKRRVVVWRIAAVAMIAMAISGLITGDYYLLIFLIMFSELWRVPDSYRRGYFGAWLYSRTQRFFAR